MKKLIVLVFISQFVFIGVHSSYGQVKESASSAKKADAYFLDENYKSAYNIYNKLHNKYPKEANYTYKLGVTSLFVLDEKDKALPLLESVAKNPSIEKEIHYYLGKAYMLNYRYVDAIDQFEKYKKVASQVNIKKFQIQRQIEMCSNGKDMAPNLTDWEVKEKKKVNKEKFLLQYDSKLIAGKIYEKPDDKFYNTNLDYLYEKDITTVFENKDSSFIVMSSYGLVEEGEGKNIYLVKTLPNGIFAYAQKLPSTINSTYDEDFPFLDAQNKTLYFSSKGHNSIGGYDIFKSTFNDTTNTWNAPENMGVPINSPDDDILFVTDSSGSIAYYSSAQNCSYENINVYKLIQQKRFDDLILIKGGIIPKQQYRTEIKVIDLNNCSITGIYRPNRDLEKYILILPNGGKYLFEIKTANFKTQYKMVDVKRQNDFKILFQEISFDASRQALNIKMLDTVENLNNVGPVVFNTKPVSIKDSVIITDISDVSKLCSNVVDTTSAIVTVTTETDKVNYKLMQGSVRPTRINSRNKTMVLLPTDTSLFYSVQVGLFSTPKPHKVFNNIQPLYLKERTDGKFLYTVGTYENLLKAEEAKYIIRQLGITDAFVVAFKNNKQIPVIGDDEDWELMKQIKDSVREGREIAEPSITKKINSLPKDSLLFYTIQTPIYNKTKTEANILTINPLYAEYFPSEKVRYSIGVYNSIEVAQYAVKTLNDLGIKNIFVTAFYKGNRISVEKAKECEGKGIKTLVTSTNINVMPYKK